MPDQISLCFSDCVKMMPSNAGNTQQTDTFLTDNPHINGMLTKGMPFIVRQNPEDQRPWQALRPDLAGRLNDILSTDYTTRCNIAEINNYHGSDILSALSALHQAEIAPLLTRLNHYKTTIRNETAGLAGASATAMESRLSGFGKAASKYQQTLENLRRGTQAKLPRVQLRQLEQLVRNAHTILNERFKAELTRFATKGGRRGTIWTNPTRGIHIATSARTTKPIEITTKADFNSIIKFSKLANVAGKGFIVLDAGFRTENVVNDFKAGKDWQRSMVTEVTGFGLGTAAGVYAGVAATNALTGLGIAMLATPVGWVFVIGVGLAAGYLSAKGLDKFGKSFSGYVYDNSVSWNPF